MVVTMKMVETVHVYYRVTNDSEAERAAAAIAADGGRDGGGDSGGDSGGDGG